MGQPVVHFEVMGSDADKLKAFYTDMFGWELQDVGGPASYAVTQREGSTNTEGAGIGGGIGGGMEGGGHVTFYVEVPDIEAWLSKAEGLGGQRLMGPDEVPGQGILIAMFADPEGHTIGLVQNIS